MSRFKENGLAAFERVKLYIENDGLEDTLNHCYQELNTLGLHDAVANYEYARSELESKIQQLYEVFYTAQATQKATEAKG